VISRSSYAARVRQQTSLRGPGKVRLLTDRLADDLYIVSLVVLHVLTLPTHKR